MNPDSDGSSPSKSSFILQKEIRVGIIKALYIEVVAHIRP